MPLKKVGLKSRGGPIGNFSLRFNKGEVWGYSVAFLGPKVSQRGKFASWANEVSSRCLRLLQELLDRFLKVLAIDTDRYPF